MGSNILRTKYGLVIGACVILYTLFHFANAVLDSIYSVDSCEFSEFFINFQAGFVRRGLLGEALFVLVKATGWSVYNIIRCICIFCFIACLGLFLRQFIRLKLNWWFLFLPVTFGLSLFLIRKDYLLYLIIIAAVWLVGKNKNITILRLVISGILLATGIMIHEAFIFYGVPLVALIVWRSTTLSKRSKLIYLSSLGGVFLLMAYFKGNYETAYLIFRSWVPYNDYQGFHFSTEGGLGAISWDTLETFSLHLHKNFYREGWGWSGIIIRPLQAVVVYYFVMNFLYVLRTNDKTFTKEMQTIYCSLYLLIFVCLLPMFTVLSCDYGRLYQYATLTALVGILFASETVIKHLIPLPVYSVVFRLNTKINSFCPPRRWLLIVLMFCLTISPFYFNPLFGWQKSIAYTLYLLGKLVLGIM